MKNPKRYWTETWPLGPIHRFVFHDEGYGALYLIPVVLVPIGMAGISEAFWDGWPVAVTGMVTLLALIAAPLIPLFSTLRKMDDQRYWDSGNMGSKTLVRKVLALPREDRKAFPYNLAETLSRDLPHDERHEINKRVAKMLKEINTRNILLAEAKRRSIPTDGILAALDDAHESMRIETETIREFL